MPAVEFMRYNDGMERTAWVMARLSLQLNGVRIAFDKEDAIRTVPALAAGNLAEDALTARFRARVVRA